MDVDMSDQAAEKIFRILLFYRDLFIKGTFIKHNGIQVAQFKLLNLLSQEDSLSMSSLGRHLYISKPYMTTLIDSLIKDELVERHPDPHDRRVINVTITAKGRKNLEEIQNYIQEKFRSLLSSLEPSDIETITRSADQLLNVLSKIQ